MQLHAGHISFESKTVQGEFFGKTLRFRKWPWAHDIVVAWSEDKLSWPPEYLLSAAQAWLERVVSSYFL